MKKWAYRQRFLDDFLVLMMLCISGNPAFVSVPTLGKIVNIIMLIILIVVSRFKFKLSTIKTSAFWIVLLVIIFTGQYILLGEITVLGSLNYIAKMLCAILLAAYLGDRLPKATIRVMSIICLISLIFYVINLAGVRFKSPLDLKMKSECLIIYTQTWEDPLEPGIFRNSGMFWEPGAFAGYIIATLMMFVDHLDVLWKKYPQQFILLSVTLLTTTSTTGYIAFFLLMLYYVLKWGAGSTKKRIISVAVVSLIIVSGIYAFASFDFLGKKIQKQYQATEKMKETDVSDSRFGSILFDIPYILSHPVFGNGLALSTRLRFHLGVYEIEDLDEFGNGFSGCIATMGLLFMIAYLAAIGLNPTLKAKAVVIMMIILMLQGEYFLNYPFFMMFPFINFGSATRTAAKKRRAIKFVWNKKQVQGSLS